MSSKLISKLNSMGKDNKFYIKFYIKDFQTNRRVRNCSANTIGIYIFIICLLADDGEKYGKYTLEENILKDFAEILPRQNEQQTNQQIIQQIPNICRAVCLHFAKHLPYEKEEICQCLEELLRNDILYFEGNTLCQKRMIRDAYISRVRSKSGGLGAKKTNNKSKKRKKGFAEILPRQNEQQNPNYNYLLLKEVEVVDREGGIGNEGGVQGEENPGGGKVPQKKFTVSDQNKNIAINFYESTEMADLYFTSQKFSVARERLAMGKFLDLPTLRLWADAFNTYLISHAIDVNSDGLVVKQDSDWAKHFAFWLAKQDMTMDPKNLDAERRKKYSETAKKFGKVPEKKTVSDLDRQIADETDPDKRRQLQFQKYAVVR